MTTIATTFSRQIGSPRTAYQICSRKTYLKRFRYFIEHSDWDERIIALEERANKICVGVIMTAVLSFVPVLVKVFLR